MTGSMWREKEYDVLTVLVIYGNFSVILARARLFLNPLYSCQLVILSLLRSL